MLTLRRPQFDPAAIAPHGAHLDALRESGQLELAGPFSDRSGGAYLLRTETREAAESIAYRDPLHVSGSSDVHVYEWIAT